MQTSEKIVKAEQRISELRTLIRYWKKDNPQVYLTDVQSINFGLNESNDSNLSAA